MNAMTRRALFGASAATLAAPPAVLAAMPAATLGVNDHRLRQLHEAAIQARIDQNAAYARGGNFQFSEIPAERAAYEQYVLDAEASVERWKDALFDMAEVAADTAYGLSVKLVHLLYGMKVGTADCEDALAESLAADVARLFPGLSAEEAVCQPGRAPLMEALA